MNVKDQVIFNSSYISIQSISKLRKATNCGIKDCKSALLACGGDHNSAIEYLVRLGQLKNIDKRTRETKNGIIATRLINNKLYVVPLLCETDFVSQSDTFINWGERVLDLYSIGNTDLDYDKLIGEITSKLGENISIGDVRIYNFDQYSDYYIHSTKRLFSYVRTRNSTDKKLLRELVLHICAYDPQYLSIEDIPQSELDYQRQLIADSDTIKDLIYNKDNLNIDRIIDQKLKKNIKELCLYDQNWITDQSGCFRSLYSGEHQVLQFERISI